MQEELRGRTEPRIYVPPKRELTPETSHGFSAIAFAEQLLGMKLFPWQEWLLIHALELNEDGLYRFRVVVVSVARQNGKTLVETVLALWHMFVLKSPQVIGTAQDLGRADTAWKEAVALAQNSDELAELIPDNGVYLGHPKQFTAMHDDGARAEYRIAASSRKGGRGFSGDLILLDELREHTSFDAWSAVTNTMNARPRAQAWAFSNAGDALSVVLRHQRALAHRELGWPDGDSDVQGEMLEQNEELPEFENAPEVEFSTGWFEWSMAPGLPRNHPEGLMQANPSCNHTDIAENCITWRTIMSGVHNTPSREAETEICCRWNSSGTGGPFPEDSWQNTFVAESNVSPEAKSVACVEIPTRRSRSVITRAALDRDEVPTVGVWADEQGTEWIADFLSENRSKYEVVIIRGTPGAPVLSVLDELVDREIETLEWKGRDIGVAHSMVFDMLRDNNFRHLEHTALDMAATSAEALMQPSGGWVVDFKRSPSDTAPLYAAIGAVWGLYNMPDNESVYAKEDVFIL